MEDGTLTCSQDGCIEGYQLGTDGVCYRPAIQCTVNTRARCEGCVDNDGAICQGPSGGCGTCGLDACLMTTDQYGEYRHPQLWEYDKTCPPLR